MSSKSSTKQYQIGDRVRWDSQSGGSWVTKQGVVVYVFDGSGETDPTIVHATNFPKTRRMFSGTIFRDRPGYLVQVPGGRTGKATPKLYLPLAKSLEAAPTPTPGAMFRALLRGQMDKA